ncbi:ComEC/Rec2 family competence protein [Croceitalea marina]|uniref:ComEC/Rec2 family competence protein n=1 Tax=Croceitalea marina TaxID=1775166 RepID=A0ABW5MVH1_9FLAO
MRQFNFISVKLTIALILGIIFGFYAEPKLHFVLTALTILIVVLAITFKKQQRDGFPFFGLIASFTVVALGVSIVAISNPKNGKSHFLHQLKTDKNVWVIKVDEILKPSPFSKRYIVKAKNLNENKVTGKLVLRIASDSLGHSLQVDDELLVYANAETVPGPLNPNQFDYQGFLKKKQIYHQLNITESQFLLQSNSQKTLFGYASSIRFSLIEKLKKENFGEEERAIIQALLLGQRNDISEDTYNNYKNAGAVHILAVSGLHIGILLLLLQFILKPLEFLAHGKIIKLIAIMVFLWGFAFIAGLSASIVRAVTMFSFIAYALFLNRPTNTFNIVALSMFFILLVEPLFLFQVGFQMSYAAVITIVWIYPKLQRFWHPENRSLRKVWQLLSVSIAAQLGVLPLSLFYFHQFPALFFVSNLVVIPFLGLILGTGICVLILASLNILPEFVATFYNFLIGSMNSVIEFVAAQEAFVFRDIPFDSIQLLLSYSIVVFFVIFLSRPKFKNLVFVLVGLIIFQAWVVLKNVESASKEELILTHEIANTTLLKQKGKHLQVFGKPTQLSKQLVSDYKTAERIDTISSYSLQNSFSIENSKIYVMDSLGIYPRTELDHLVLTQSPKINLERLLDSIKVKNVIVDGSNYKSYINRWRATCQKQKLPFHYTGEKGAYYFK